MAEFLGKLPLIDPGTEEGTCNQTNTNARSDRTWDRRGCVSEKNRDQPNREEHADEKMVNIRFPCAKTVAAIQKIIIDVESNPYWKKCWE